MNDMQDLIRVADSFDDGYDFLTDSQDLDDIVDTYGLGSINREQITGAFVLARDGTYIDVWLTEDSKPYDIKAQYLPVKYYYEGLE